MPRSRTPVDPSLSGYQERCGDRLDTLGHLCDGAFVLGVVTLLPAVVLFLTGHLVAGIGLVLPLAVAVVCGIVGTGWGLAAARAWRVAVVADVQARYGVTLRGRVTPDAVPHGARARTADGATIPVRLTFTGGLSRAHLVRMDTPLPVALPTLPQLPGRVAA